jgi:ComF family protein
MKARASIGWLQVALGFFYPEWCQICAAQPASPSDGFVCRHCRDKIPWIEPPFCSRCGLPFEGQITATFECSNCREMELHFRSARSAATARGVVLEAVHRYKYHRALWFEPFLAGLLVGRAAPELSGANWDWLVPVPLHPLKEREREFNQAERLAARLSDSTRIPLNAHLLKRIKPTETQTLLSRKDRAANVRSAFCLRREQRLDAKRIVLVDDVFTTGATTSACARVLRRAGAAEVCVWTVARGI